jgi:NADH dehydrogenase FAD-containing subunit
MGNSSSVRSESRVVIVGGGYGGVNVAINLDNYCHVILIDPKPYFHHCIASLRAAASSTGFEKKVLIPYEPAIEHGEFKQGTVIGVNTSEKYVTLQGEEKVNYDYLVLACGSSNDFPGISIVATELKDTI